MSFFLLPFYLPQNHNLFLLKPSYTSSMFHRAIPFSAVLRCPFTLFTDQHLSLLKWVVPFTRSKEPTSYWVVPFHHRAILFSVYWVVPFKVPQNETFFLLTELYLSTFKEPYLFQFTELYLLKFHRTKTFSVYWGVPFKVPQNQNLFCLLRWTFPRSTKPRPLSAQLSCTFPCSKEPYFSLLYRVVHFYLPQNYTFH